MRFGPLCQGDRRTKGCYVTATRGLEPVVRSQPEVAIDRDFVTRWRQEKDRPKEVVPVQVKAEPEQVMAAPVQVKANHVQVKPNHVQVKPNHVQVKPNYVQVKPKLVQVKTEPIKVESLQVTSHGGDKPSAPPASGATNGIMKWIHRTPRQQQSL
jgi:hypothetical protein